MALRTGRDVLAEASIPRVGRQCPSAMADAPRVRTQASGISARWHIGYNNCYVAMTNMMWQPLETLHIYKIIHLSLIWPFGYNNCYVAVTNMLWQRLETLHPSLIWPYWLQ